MPHFCFIYTRPLRFRLIAAAFGATLLFALSGISAAYALPGRTFGPIKKLKDLGPRDTIRVVVQTPEGIHQLALRRKLPLRPPLYLVNGQQLDSTELIQPKLFVGEVLPRNGQDSPRKLRGVAADLYRGKLKLRFYGRRSSRLYTATVNLRASSPSGASVAHLPSSFPVRCASASHFGESSTVAKFALIREATVRRALDFAAEADYEFFVDNGENLSDANAQLAAAINVVNGIYGAQLGLEIVTAAQNIFTDSSQPYTTTEATALLDSFAAYRNANTFGVGVDAANLFTGKSMFEPSVGQNVVGVAYLSINEDFSDPGVICRYSNQYSYSVTERTNSNATYLGVLAAHEVGHNLSLLHTESGVMNAAPSASETSFSNESVSAATSYISSFGSCLDRLGPGLMLSRARVRNQSFNALFSLDQYSGESCSVRLYASSNRFDLITDSRRHTRAKLLRKRAVTSGEDVRFQGNLRGITAGAKVPYYVAGELRCDGRITALSEIRSVKTNVKNFISRARSALRRKG